MNLKEDNSRELKRGEVKQIILRVMSEVLPDFDFLSHKNGKYTFQRLRKAFEIDVFELFHIGFSLKNRGFSCSIASRINPSYTYRNDFNTGLINPHTDLKVLRHKTGILNIKDAYYYHNGKVETTANVVTEICRDYKEFGLSFLDSQFDRLITNQIVATGIDYINNLTVDKAKLRNEVESNLNNGKYVISDIKQEVYLDLKSKLQSVTGQSREDRKHIPKVALEFLEIYWTS